MNRFALAFLFFVPGLACAAASTLQDASQLFRQGQSAQALEKVNSHLAGNPKDAQGRFLRGLILAELNRPQEAIKTFTELSDDYPELPEPYNNLAVLYAAQGQFERAKHSLEMAIRTHPSYATAHENLGDIYAKMASVAYDKALQLDKSNTSAQMKLALVKDIFTPAGIDKAKPGKSPATKTAALANPPASMPDAAAANPGKPETAKAATASQDKSAKAKKAGTPTEQVEQTVGAWAEAWSKRDVPGYLSFYAPNFQVPSGMDRAAWEALRDSRLTRPSYIKVELSKMAVKVSGKQATATFSQRYESDILKDNTRKTLTLENQDGNWKIVSER